MVFSHTTAASTKEEDDAENEMMDIDEQFQQALFEEFENATRAAEASSKEGAEPADDDDDLVEVEEDDLLQDSLLGLEQPAAMALALQQQQQEHQQRTAGGAGKMRSAMNNAMCVGYRKQNPLVSGSELCTSPKAAA